MEEVRNNEVLGDLYALRAGLSVISQNADELANAQEAVDEKMEDVLRNQMWYLPTNTDDSVNNPLLIGEVGEWVAGGSHYQFEGLIELKEKYGCNVTDDDSDENIDCNAKELGKKAFVEWLRTDDMVDYFTKEKELNERAISDGKSKLKTCKPQLIVGIILTILGLVMAVINLSRNSTILIGLIAFALLAIGLAVSIVAWKKVKKYKKQVISGKEEVMAFDDSLSGLKESKEVIETLDKEYGPIIESVKSNYNSLFTALKKKFCQLIDIRDWQYLDVIIYYFETGRADNMKEALQLLEREIQTERIIGAIDTASKRICSAINVAVSTLSSQLSVISNQLSQSIALQQKQLEQTQMILNEEKMRNALIAKANVTSEKLMNDVNYIKNYCA